MKKLILLHLIFLPLTLLHGQTLFEPNYSLKSPMTLNIINIELKHDATIVNLSIENLIDGGYFCIDPETYIISEKGSKYRISNIVGLPFCPEQYSFSHKGETKYFTMTFPAIDIGTGWIDIIEECGENCLEITGLCLDPALNAKLNICFRELDKGRKTEAIKKFERLKDELSGSGNPVLGSVYLNLISLYRDQGNDKKAEELRTELSNTALPHKDKFLHSIR